MGGQGDARESCHAPCSCRGRRPTPRARLARGAFWTWARGGARWAAWASGVLVAGDVGPWEGCRLGAGRSRSGPRGACRLRRPRRARRSMGRAWRWWRGVGREGGGGSRPRESGNESGRWSVRTSTSGESASASCRIGQWWREMCCCPTIATRPGGRVPRGVTRRTGPRRRRLQRGTSARARAKGAPSVRVCCDGGRAADGSTKGRS